MLDLYGTSCAGIAEPCLRIAAQHAALQQKSSQCKPIHLAPTCHLSGNKVIS
jgi:hypothetical protein